MGKSRVYPIVVSTFILLVSAFAVSAQDTGTDPRAATGGAQTLSDIMKRQEKLKIDDSFRKNAIGDPEAAAPTTEQLGTLGGVSDSELWRALRYDVADVTPSYKSPASKVIIQDGGMWWLEVRNGPLKDYGGYALLGMLGLLVLFYVIKGKIRIEGGPSGVKILRFKLIERFGHWLMAGSFVLLGITGLISLFGRFGLIPLIGKEAFASIAAVGIFVHNWTSWGFMVGLVLVFFMWVLENIPNRHDLKWLAMGGGFIGKGHHPPSKKFNAGQKIIFWIVVVFGVSISVSGLSLLFPYQLPLFAPTFEFLNSLGIPQMIGFGELETQLAPHEEMQFAQLWHAIIAFGFIAVILAHIYIGSIGMEGALDAMTTGKVDKNWAKEHHNLWVAELEEAEKSGPESSKATPAE
jgi:formate dehydrogenase subunit gamma